MELIGAIAILLGSIVVMLVLWMTLTSGRRSRSKIRHQSIETPLFSNQILLAQRSEIEALRSELMALKAQPDPVGTANPESFSVASSQSEFDQIQRSHAQELEAMKARYEVEINSLQATHQAELERVQSIAHAETERSQSEMVAMEAQHQLDLQQKELELNVKQGEIEELEKETELLMTASAQDMKTFYQQRIQALQTQITTLHDQRHALTTQRDQKEIELNTLLNSPGASTSDEQSFKQFQHQRMKLEVEHRVLIAQLSVLEVQQVQYERLLHRFQERQRAIAPNE